MNPRHFGSCSTFNDFTKYENWEEQAHPPYFIVGYVELILISFEQNLGYSFNVGNGCNAIIFKAILFLRFAVAVTNS